MFYFYIYAELIRYYSKKVTIAENIKRFDIKICSTSSPYQNLIRISNFIILFGFLNNKPNLLQDKNVCITNKFILRN